MNEHLVLPAVLLVLFALAVPAAAQFSLMPYVGYNLSAGMSVDPEDEDARRGAFLVGLGAGIGLPMTGPVDISVRPSIEYLFLSGDTFSEEGLQFDVSQSRLNFNADVVAELSTPGAVTPFAGAGFAWTSYRVSGEFCFMGECASFSDTETGIGFSILGGIELGTLGFASPYVQARYTILSLSSEGDFNEESIDLNALTISAGLVIPLTR